MSLFVCFIFKKKCCHTLVACMAFVGAADPMHPHLTFLWPNTEQALFLDEVVSFLLYTGSLNQEFFIPHWTRVFVDELC